MRLDKAQERYDEAVAALHKAERRGASDNEITRKERLADRALETLQRAQRAEGHGRSRHSVR